MYNDERTFEEYVVFRVVFCSGDTFLITLQLPPLGSHPRRNPKRNLLSRAGGWSPTSPFHPLAILRLGRERSRLKAWELGLLFTGR